MATLSTEQVRAYWQARQPKMLALLDLMEAGETWAVRDIQDPEQFAADIREGLDLIDQLSRRPDRDQKGRLCIPRANEVLAALPATMAMYILMMADADYSDVSYALVKSAFDDSHSSPESHVMWQRVRILARHHLLVDIAREVSEGVI